MGQWHPASFKSLDKLFIKSHEEISEHSGEGVNGSGDGSSGGNEGRGRDFFFRGRGFFFRGRGFFFRVVGFRTIFRVWVNFTISLDFTILCPAFVISLKGFDFIAICGAFDVLGFSFCLERREIVWYADYMIIFIFISILITIRDCTLEVAFSATIFFTFGIPWLGGSSLGGGDECGKSEGFHLCFVLFY